MMEGEEVEVVEEEEEKDQESKEEQEILEDEVEGTDDGPKIVKSNKQMAFEDFGMDTDRIL